MTEKKPPLPMVIFRMIDDAVREVYGETFCMVMCYYLHGSQAYEMGLGKRLVVEPRKTYDKLISVLGNEATVKIFLALVLAKILPNNKDVRPIVEELISALKDDNGTRVLEILEEAFS